jgi:hypothetical protein
MTNRSNKNMLNNTNNLVNITQTTMGCHFTTVMTIVKKERSDGKDVKKLELLHTVAWNSNGAFPMENSMESLEKVKNRICKSTFEYSPKGIEIKILNLFEHSSVNCSTIHDSQDVEKVHMSPTEE